MKRKIITQKWPDVVTYYFDGTNCQCITKAEEGSIAGYHMLQNIKISDAAELNDGLEKKGLEALGYVTFFLNGFPFHPFKVRDPYKNSRVHFLLIFMCVRVPACRFTGIDRTPCTLCRSATDQQILFIEVTTSPFESVGQG